MSELMTLREVLSRAKVNDIIKFCDGRPIEKTIKITQEIHSQANTIDGLLIGEICRPSWKIVHIEPVVLSPEQQWLKFCDQNPTERNMVKFARECIKNGELKERQNLQPLIDAMEKGGDNLHVWYEKVWAAYQNIKPLSGD